jgi:hypothetical protein
LIARGADIINGFFDVTTLVLSNHITGAFDFLRGDFTRTRFLEKGCGCLQVAILAAEN